MDQLEIIVPIEFAAGCDVIENMHIVNENRAAQSGRGRWMLLKHMEGFFARHGWMSLGPSPWVGGGISGSRQSPRATTSISCCLFCGSPSQLEVKTLTCTW
jgi:hypothetical protein